MHNVLEHALFVKAYCCSWKQAFKTPGIFQLFFLRQSKKKCLRMWVNLFFFLFFFFPPMENKTIYFFTFTCKNSKIMDFSLKAGGCKLKMQR